MIIKKKNSNNYNNYKTSHAEIVCTRKEYKCDTNFIVCERVRASAMLMMDSSAVIVFKK